MGTPTTKIQEVKMIYSALKLTASLHLKIDGWNMNFLLGFGLFSGAMFVSFREGIYI